MSERFFILTPTPTNDPHVYRDGSEVPMKWSGKYPIPAVGTEIRVTMNGIGSSVVKGYFESHGWVGLMILPNKPPKYYVEQTKKHQNDPKKPQWVKDGIGCVFGIEAEPL